MTVALMHLGVWSWSRQSPELRNECFESGMVVRKCLVDARGQRKMGWL